MKIAIISSADVKISKKSKKIIKEIINRIKSIPKVTILTGASLGIPGCAVQQAKIHSIHTTAYSPDIDSDKHHQRYDNLKLSYFNQVKHYSGFTMRSLDMIKEADCILVLNGRMGTLSEFTIALEEGKKVGVLTKTGGISNHLEKIVNWSKKDFSGRVFFSSNIDEVINFLVKKYK